MFGLEALLKKEDKLRSPSLGFSVSVPWTTGSQGSKHRQSENIPKLLVNCEFPSDNYQKIFIPLHQSVVPNPCLLMNLKSSVCVTSLRELLLPNFCVSAFSAWGPFSPFFSRSHIGKAILSQPACVSKLLSLLLDQRPSPKLVLIILQLCRAALPLMSVEDCGNVELPPWSYSVPSLNSEQEDPSDPASKIASLLLAKLADYVVPGEPLWTGECTKVPTACAWSA